MTEATAVVKTAAMIVEMVELDITNGKGGSSSKDGGDGRSGGY
jgi:hypothetical protein